jgi:hypothetical protein
MDRSISTRMALLTFGIALVACGTDDRAKPGDAVSLTFTGKAGSDYSFALENPTSHPIYFRGNETLWFATIPVDIAFDCKNEKTGESTIGGFPLFDGGKDPPIVAVSPGKAIKLRIKISTSGFRLAEHNGEPCKMQLRLWQPNTLQQRAENIESQEFKP